MTGFNSVPFLSLAVVAVLFLLPTDIQGQSSSSLTLIGKSKNKTFFSTKHPVTWYQAGVFCEEHGFQRASIESQDEQRIIDDLAGNKIEAIEWTGFWLDATAEDGVATEWRWNGTQVPIGFSNWDTGFPTQIGDRDNGTLHLGRCAYTAFENYDARWREAPCIAAAFNPLCMMRKRCESGGGPTTAEPLPPTTEDPFPTMAPLSDLIHIGGMTHPWVSYYTQNVSLNWTQAKDYCEKYGLELASIESKAEHDLMNQWAAWNGNSKDWVVWTSGMDVGTSTLPGWEWTATGNPIPSAGDPQGFEEWNSGSPQSSRNLNLTCLAARLDNSTSGTWSAVGCGWSHRPMCTSITKPRATTTTMASSSITAATAGPSTIQPSVTSSSSDLVYVGTSDSGKVFYTHATALFNSSQTLDFCASHGLQVASIDTIQEGVFISMWAAGEAVRELINLVASGGRQGGSSPIISLNCVLSTFVDSSLWTSFTCQPFGRPLCTLTPTLATSTAVPTTTLPQATTMANDLVWIGNSSAKQFYGHRLNSSWATARQICTARGLQLASIETADDQDVLTRFAVANAAWSLFWTSGSDESGVWRWTDTGNAIPLTGGSTAGGFENWMPTQPPTPNGRCVVSYLSSGRSWYATPCNQERPTLCMSKTPGASTVPMPTTTAATATATPISSNGELTLIGSWGNGTYTKTFFFHVLPMTWTEALKLCNSRGYELVSIESAAEQEILNRTPVQNASLTAYNNYWTSGTDQADAVWKWFSPRGGGNPIPLDGSQVGYENWADSNPQMTGNSCLVSYMVPGRNWYVMPCNHQRSVICMLKQIN